MVDRPKVVRPCGVFLPFWLQNVLPATTACTFTTSEPPKVVRAYGVFPILTSKCALQRHAVHFFTISTSKSGLRPWVCLTLFGSKCASRHNDVQVFISHLPRQLRTCGFSKPSFRPSRATNHWKNIMNRDFSTFSRAYIGSLTSKLPSVNIKYCLSPISVLCYTLR